MLDLQKAHYSEPSFHREGDKWGLYVTAVGCAEIEPRESYPPSQKHPRHHDFEWDSGRVLPDYHLVWIARGHGEYQFEGARSGKVREGAVLWVPAKRWHRYRPAPRSGWTEFWVDFNGDIAHRWRRSGAVDPQAGVLENLAQDSLGQAFKGLIAAARSAVEGRSQLVAAELFQLLARAMEQRSDAGNAGSVQKADPLVSEAIALIWARRREVVTVESVLDEIPVARRTLERAFRRQLGHGIYEEILKCRLRRAEELLSDDILSIQAVATESGFGDVRSFRRAFTTSTGMSPQAFRASREADTQLT